MDISQDSSAPLHDSLGSFLGHYPIPGEQHILVEARKLANSYFAGGTRDKALSDLISLAYHPPSTISKYSWELFDKNKPSELLGCSSASHCWLVILTDNPEYSIVGNVFEIDNKLELRMHTKAEPVSATPKATASDIYQLDLPYHTSSDSCILLEGGSFETTSASIERNPRVRTACLKFHGTLCAACGLSPNDAYGAGYDSIIQIHHLNPICNATIQRAVDPQVDLIPLCANCHTIAHSTTPPLPTSRIREIVCRSRSI